MFLHHIPLVKPQYSAFSASLHMPVGKEKSTDWFHPQLMTLILAGSFELFNDAILFFPNLVLSHWNGNPQHLGILLKMENQIPWLSLSSGEV